MTAHHKQEMSNTVAQHSFVKEHIHSCSEKKLGQVIYVQSNTRQVQHSVQRLTWTSST